MEKAYLIKIDIFFTSAPETRVNNLFLIKLLTENWRAKSWLAEVHRNSGHKGLWRPLKLYSCASLIQLKHHCGLRCWNHLVLWMHSFVLKIPFSHPPGKTEVESKLVNALKWIMFLTGNPPTIFPKRGSLKPNASFKEKGTSKVWFGTWVGNEVTSCIHSVLMKLNLLYLTCSRELSNTVLMFEVVRNQIWLQGFSATTKESHETTYVSLG